MKPNHLAAAILLTVIPLLASCARERHKTNSAPSPHTEPADALLLTNREGSLRFTAPAGIIGPMALHAFGESFFDSGTSIAPDDKWLRIDGQAISTTVTNSFYFSTNFTGAECHYLRIEGLNDGSTGLKTLRRHVLLIDENLVVLLDEVTTTNSSRFETTQAYLQQPSYDAPRDEWNLNLAHAGLTTRILTSPRSKQVWFEGTSPTLKTISKPPTAGALRTTATESGFEWYQLSIHAAHQGQSKPSLGFKLLESDTAIGARIHRDGLPTLVAFRKASCTGEANLTGLKFTAPVAVDVFRPRPRQQRLK